MKRIIIAAATICLIGSAAVAQGPASGRGAATAGVPPAETAMQSTRTAPANAMTKMKMKKRMRRARRVGDEAKSPPAGR